MEWLSFALSFGNTFYGNWTLQPRLVLANHILSHKSNTRHVLLHPHLNMHWQSKSQLLWDFNNIATHELSFKLNFRGTSNVIFMIPWSILGMIIYYIVGKIIKLKEIMGIYILTTIGKVLDYNFLHSFDSWNWRWKTSFHLPHFQWPK